MKLFSYSRWFCVARMFRETIDTFQKSPEARYTTHIPGVIIAFVGTHKCQIHFDSVRADERYLFIRVDNVAFTLTHFVAVRAEDKSPVDPSLIRFGFGDETQVKEGLLPKARIEQVHSSVLGPTKVNINGHPLLLSLE